MDRINRKLKYLNLTIVLQTFLMIASIVNAQPSSVKFVLRGETAPVSVTANIQINASVVFTEINKAAKEKRSLRLSPNNATEDAIRGINSLWEISHFYCLKPTYYQTINEVTLHGGYSVRNISVYFSAENTLDNKNQDIVLHFDRNGKLSNVFIATEREQWEKIIENAKDVEETRHRIMAWDFLEHFRTAYCNKDIDFINKIFSEHALIITGHKIEIMDRETRILKSSVRYTEKDKTKYIDDLEIVFKNNKSLDIKFPEEKIRIFQHPNNEKIYAIRCWQDWTSIRLDGIEGYRDSGWLTLIIDFTKEDKPQIWVRAWQAPNFTEDELIKVGDFNF